VPLAPLRAQRAPAKRVRSMTLARRMLSIQFENFAKAGRSTRRRPSARWRTFGGTQRDGSDPDGGREAAFDFFHSHGQSLDWVLAGDIRGMIRGLKFPFSRARGAWLRMPRRSKTALPKIGQVSWRQVKNQNLADTAIHSGRKSSWCPRRDYSRRSEISVARSFEDQPSWRTALARASPRCGGGAIFSERVRASGGTACDGSLVTHARRLRQ
jgi:hypothetical protein